ncbi:hypothetical protein PKF032_08230 [Polynucleobacter yangtzensis]|uniref:Uncharacterized protein n=1 Tax=Polynucleobacter yangtzensis TaxID=1743159 RepID=A0ABN6TSY1_9BURK|nr:hypothetical protein PKF032_08230 [Polynucleobacter yangtzensis]
MGGVFLAYTSEPWLTATYRFPILSKTPIKVDKCNENDANEYESYKYKTPKGRYVSVTLCLEKMPIERDGSVKYVLPYKSDGKVFWYVDVYLSKYGSDLSSQYLKSVIDSFKFPEKDGAEIDNSYWRGKLDKVWEYVQGTALCLLIWAIFYVVVRFIWRGFTNRD